MASEKDLGHLLKLLDDESPAIREKVWTVLAAHLPAWGESLESRLAELPSGARGRIRGLLTEKLRASFRAGWGRWRDLPDETDRLEAALGGLSAYLSGGAFTGFTGGSGSGELGKRLDDLAEEFLAGERPVSASRLALFLFTEKGLQGAESDYYDPRNSDLAHVIDKGRGIPISLACIFILVGRRLKLEIEGCDVPEHFLTRASEEGEELIIDCYDGGKVLGPERLDQLERKYAPDFTRLLRSPASAEAIVARVLRNLINAYHLSGDKAASEFMWSLAEDLRGGGNPEPAPDPAEDEE